MTLGFLDIIEFITNFFLISLESLLRQQFIGSVAKIANELFSIFRQAITPYPKLGLL